MAAKQEVTEAETLINSEKLKGLKEKLITNHSLRMKMHQLPPNRKGERVGKRLSIPVLVSREASVFGERKGVGTSRGQLVVNTARNIQAQEKDTGWVCSF